MYVLIVLSTLRNLIYDIINVSIDADCIHEINLDLIVDVYNIITFSPGWMRSFAYTHKTIVYVLVESLRSPNTG